MARTTLAIDDDLLRRLKQRAAADGRALQSVVNDLLRRALARSPRRSDYRLELRGWAARQLPGIDLLDRDRLLDVLGDRSP